MLGIFIKTNSSYGESHKTWHKWDPLKILQKAVVKELLKKKTSTLISQTSHTLF